MQLSFATNCKLIMQKQGCPWDQRTSESLAERGDLQELAWACLQQGCALGPHTVARAARTGQLHVLRFLHDKQVAMDEETCCNAARGGHLDVLQWARSQVGRRIVSILNI